MFTKNTTFLYHKPDKSSSSIYVFVFLVALSTVSPSKFSSILATWPADLSLLVLIILIMFERISNYGASHYANFSNVILTHCYYLTPWSSVIPKKPTDFIPLVLNIP
jgi:hypothetical protein